MKKFSIVLLIGAAVIVIIELTLINYADFWGTENRGSLAVIFGMVLLIISLLISIKSSNKNP